MVLKPGLKHTVVIVALTISAIVATVFYYLHDPASGGIAPRCTFKALTGYDCPGCGFQRALHAALHGQFAEAWSYNPILFFLIPVAQLYALVEATPGRFRRLRCFLLHPAAIIAIGLIIIAWWIIRNI